MRSRRVVDEARIRPVRLILTAALVFATAANAQVRVNGLAYDSLAKAPLANAFIAIPRLHKSTTSDSLGRFTFDGIAAGTYAFYMQHEALDAIGMADIVQQIQVRGENDRVVVAIPAFASLWSEMCGGSPPSDSAIVFGTVANKSRQPAAGASVTVRWLDLVVTSKKSVSQHQRQGRVSTDGTGRYVLCGVPMGTGLSLHATQGALDSGPLDLLPLQNSVQRRDIQLNAPGASTVGIVTGVVTLEGREPTGTRVSIEGAPEVRVNADGKFTIRNVPVGSRGIEATFVGMSPALAVVDIAPGAITTVELALKKLVALPGMTITGSAVRTQLAREFDQRRAEGIGKYADSTRIVKYPSLESFFQDMPFTFVKGGIGRRAIYIGACRIPAAMIVDGVVTASADFAWRDQHDIAAVETYDHVVPMEFQSKVGKPCGLVVVWTKNRFP
jgi:hypothetical protein